MLQFELRTHTDLNFISASQIFALGSGANRYLPSSLQRSLVDYYQSRFPLANICARTARFTPQEPNFLRDKALLHNYILLNGRRIVASAHMFKAPNSIIQACIGNSKYVGQVYDILTHVQPPFAKPSVLLHVFWFKPLRSGTFNTIIWNDR